MTIWTIEYDNDVAPGDVSFREWWTVSDGHRVYNCASEASANALCNSLNFIESMQTVAAADVLKERVRQVSKEGWTAAHDDEHTENNMATAAACYALASQERGLSVQTVRLEKLWEWTGWSASWFKPKDKRSNLIRAAALLLAEIERLDRASAKLEQAK